MPEKPANPLSIEKKRHQARRLARRQRHASILLAIVGFMFLFLTITKILRHQDSFRIMQWLVSGCGWGMIAWRANRSDLHKSTRKVIADYSPEEIKDDLVGLIAAYRFDEGVERELLREALIKRLDRVESEDALSLRNEDFSQLIAIAASNDPFVALVALEALGKIGDQSMLTRLRRIERRTGDGAFDERIRVAAATVIEAIELRLAGESLENSLLRGAAKPEENISLLRSAQGNEDAQEDQMLLRSVRNDPSS